MSSNVLEYEASRQKKKKNIGAHLQPAFMSEYALETAIDDLTCGYGVVSTLPLYQVLGA
jgi:hypothetical protein